MTEAEPAFEMKTLLKDLVAIESPSGEPEGIRQVMRRLSQDLPQDMAMRWHDTPRGPIFEARRGSGGALLLGHADTVWPRGTLQTMPWREDGDLVYGPGTLDMKAGLVLAVAALRSSDAPAVLLVTPDEEIGSGASRPLLESRAREAQVVLVLEAGMPDGAVKIARSGVGDFHLSITGVESHAGLEPERGASAIKELAQQILWLGGLENRLLGTTLNPGVVDGGTRTNVVAGRAEGYIDVRVQTAREMERITETLAAPPRFDPRVKVEYRGAFNRPPMEPDPPMLRWFEYAASIWKHTTGQVMHGMRVGGASDGNFTARLAPTLDGLGAVGQGAHARHEHIAWSSMNPRLALLEQLLARAAEGL
ncbi:MAG: M20 family metallopeptidase [Thermaerobacter sp.]|nr:M20 family metallopeptidase [Thermaerobacter sp.]